MNDMEIKGFVQFLCFVLTLLFVFSPEEGDAQNSVADEDIVIALEEYDTAYVDSLYDLAVEYVYNKKEFDKGIIIIKKGQKYTKNNEYDYAKFAYSEGMIYFGNQNSNDDNLGYEIFMRLIEEQPKDLSPKHLGLIRLCHQKIARLDAISGNEKGMKYHCEKSMEYSEWNDFASINSVNFILEDYYREYDIDITLLYAFKRLNNYMKEYVYVFTRFPTQEEKNVVYDYISMAYHSISSCYEEKLEYKKALCFYDISNDYSAKNLNTTKLDLVLYKLDMGYLNLYLKNYNRSEFLPKSVVFGSKNLDTQYKEIELGGLSLLGDIRLAKKDFKQAKKYYEETLAVAKEFYSEDSDELHYYYEGLAIINYHLGSYQTTIDYYKKAMSLISNKKGGQYHNYYLAMASAYYLVDKKESKRLLEILLNQNIKDSTNYN